MKRYIVDFEAWTTVEAKNEDEAYAIAQGIINECVEALSNAGIELEMVVRDGGLEQEDE